MQETTERMTETATAYKKNEVLPSLTTIGRSVWSAIFSGTVAAVTANFVIGLLGVGIGLASIGASPTAIGIGAVVWSLVNVFASMYFGGWVTTRFAGMQRAGDGILHGIVTWGLTSLVLIFMLASTVGAVIRGGSGLLQGLGGTAAGVYGMLPPETQQQLQGTVQQQGGAAQQQMQTPQGQQQLQQQAANAGQQAARITSGVAWGGFAWLVIGGIGAVLGSSAGRIKGPVRI